MFRFASLSPSWNLIKKNEIGIINKPQRFKNVIIFQGSLSLSLFCKLHFHISLKGNKGVNILDSWWKNFDIVSAPVQSLLLQDNNLNWRKLENANEFNVNKEPNWITIRQ
jgi:hypothetical protein